MLLFSSNHWENIYFEFSLWEKEIMWFPVKLSGWSAFSAAATTVMIGPNKSKPLAKVDSIIVSD